MRRAAPTPMSPTTTSTSKPTFHCHALTPPPAALRPRCGPSRPGALTSLRALLPASPLGQLELEPSIAASRVARALSLEFEVSTGALHEPHAIAVLGMYCRGDLSQSARGTARPLVQAGHEFPAESPPLVCAQNAHALEIGAAARGEVVERRAKEKTDEMPIDLCDESEL